MYFMNSQHAFNYRKCIAMFGTSHNSKTMAAYYLFADPRIFDRMMQSANIMRDVRKLYEQDDSTRNLLRLLYVLTAPKRIGFDLQEAMDSWGETEFREFLQAIEIWKKGTKPTQFVRR